MTSFHRMFCWGWLFDKYDILVLRLSHSKHFHFFLCWMQSYFRFWYVIVIELICVAKFLFQHSLLMTHLEVKTLLYCFLCMFVIFLFYSGYIRFSLVADMAVKSMHVICRFCSRTCMSLVCMSKLQPCSCSIKIQGLYLE